MPDNAVPDGKNNSKLPFAVKLFTLVLTMLLPVKFGTTISVPEVPPYYASDPFVLLLTSWPVAYFCTASALLSCLAVLAKILSDKPFFKFGSRFSTLSVCVWTLLPFIALAGFVNASCLEYAFQTFFYVCGLAEYAFLLFILCSEDRAFPRHLLYAVICGLVLSCMSGLYQYVIGFDAMKNFVENDVTSGGRVKVDGNVISRISERRLSADFSSCNVFGCYVAMLFVPAACLTYGKALSVFKGRRFPAFLSGTAVVMLLARYVFLSGSRGAVASLVSGLAVASFFAVKGAKKKFLLTLVYVLVAASFVYVVSVWRGFASAQFRLDYFVSAFKMMVNDPVCGTGWGDFFHDYLQLKNLVNDEAPHTPHNAVLFFGSQCGVAGFAAALALILLPLSGAIKNLVHAKDGNDKIIKFALVSALASAFASAMVDTVFETAGFFCTFIAIGFAALFMQSDDGLDADDAPSKGRSVVLYVLFLLVFGCSLPVGFVRIRGEIAHARLYALLHPELALDANVQKRFVTVQDAANELEKASKGSPFSPFVWAQTAEFMKSRGEFSAAEKYLSEAIVRAPERAYFYEKRAQIRYALLQNADDEKILSDLTEAKRLSPKNPEYDRPLQQRLSPGVPAEEKL